MYPHTDISSECFEVIVNLLDPFIVSKEQNDSHESLMKYIQHCQQTTAFTIQTQDEKPTKWYAESISIFVVYCKKDFK